MKKEEGSSIINMSSVTGPMVSDPGEVRSIDFGISWYLVGSYEEVLGSCEWDRELSGHGLSAPNGRAEGGDS